MMLNSSRTPSVSHFMQFCSTSTAIPVFLSSSLAWFRSPPAAWLRTPTISLFFLFLSNCEKSCCCFQRLFFSLFLFLVVFLREQNNPRMANVHAPNLQLYSFRGPCQIVCFRKSIFPPRSNLYLHSFRAVHLLQLVMVMFL